MLLTLKEAARTLGVDYETARQWANSGKLRAVRLAGRRKIQVTEEAIAEFIADSEIDPHVVPISNRKPQQLTRKPRGQNSRNQQKHSEKLWYAKRG